jgi:hypothetical protein
MVMSIPLKYTCNPNRELLLLFLFCLLTTCFGPYGPSSGEIQQQHLYFKSAIDTTTDPLFYSGSFIHWCKSLIIYLQFI